MKKLLNNKYISILICIFIVILFYFLILNISGVIGVLGKFFKIISPLIYGLAIAYVIHPLVDVFEKKLFKNIKNKTVRRNLSIFITLIIIFGIVILVISIVVPELLKSIKSIIINMPSYLEALENFLKSYISTDELNDIEIRITDYLNNNILPNVNNAISSIGSGIINFISSIFTLIISVVFSVYILANNTKVIAGTKKFLYSIFNEDKSNSIIKELKHIDEIFIHFFIGKVCDSSIVLLCTLLFLIIFKFPYPLLIAVIIGLTDLIPYFGPYIGTIPSAILICLVDPIKAGIFILFILLLQQIDANLITPRIQSSATGLPSFWVLFAITLFGGLFGIVGLLIGVPLFTVIYEIVRDLINNNLKKKNLPTNLDYYETDNNFKKVLIKTFNKDDENE